jgi:exodeoxyribonuclease VII large subunit
VAASEIPVVSAVGHEIDWAISDYAADMRAPTPSAAAELVSTGRFEIVEKIRDMEAELYHTMTGLLEKARLLVKPFSLEEMEYRFRSILQPRLVLLDDAKEALLDSLKDRLKDTRRRLELARTGLEAANPQAILERGFSVVTNARTNNIVRGFMDVKTGDRLSIKPMEGIINVITEGTSDGKEL